MAQRFTASQRADLNVLWSHDDIAKGVEANSWGDHAAVGYLTTEFDPVFMASPAHTITNSMIAAWLTTETDPIFVASPANGITAPMIALWNTVAGYRYVRDYQTGIIGATLTLPSVPVSGSNVQVFKNLGLLREGVADDFTITGAVITFAVPLIAGDKIDTFYTA